MITNSGTRIINDIEFNEYPAPDELIKAMENKWAKDLVNRGMIRLSPLSYYRDLESSELSDKNEGQGELRVASHFYNASSLNEDFVWCSATPDTVSDKLLDLDDRYDTIIKILNPVEFISRIKNKLLEMEGKFSLPHAGRVIYNRTKEVTHDVLQSQR